MRVHAGEEKLARVGAPNLGETRGMLPQKMFKFRVSEMPSPAFSAGHLSK